MSRISRIPEFQSNIGIDRKLPFHFSSPLFDPSPILAIKLNFL
ncbi:MAG: hypothetical protein ACI81V_000541 [Lentimonas sp.]|jgi:hypothetical protein